MAANDKYRLPKNVSPTHYNLTFYTDIASKSFGGFVDISLDVLAETRTVQLNTNELTLGDATISSDSGRNAQQVLNASVDTELQRVEFTVPEVLPAGSNAKLKLSFNGTLKDSMTGYYLANYEENGQPKQYALTQFEPTDARAAFPCWDEPLCKSTYAITMVSHADAVNLSNMPAISETIYEPGSEQSPELAALLSSLSTEQKWKITRFATTPKMSTYIVAWATGNFKHLEKTVKLPMSGKTIPLRIYSTPDVIHQTEFALDVAARVLPIYEEVFDVAFPLPKLDTLVASDFDAGAMENFGLITGRTSALLVDPEHSDVRAKKNVANTQSHEVAHMWFGNITTMKFKTLCATPASKLTIFQGGTICFATLCGEHTNSADKIFPEWRAKSEFISDHLQSALFLDAKLSSHPIEVECKDASDINQIFDSLSYSKAASVLNMLCDYVGEDKFLRGVSIYLKRHLFGNAVTNDLFTGISEATGQDIVRFMDNWIKQQGFPVIAVTETADGIHVRQDRFIETGEVDPKENQTIWNVPLSILTTDASGAASIDRTAILNEREKTIALDTSKDFKLNSGTVGVYRVLYTPERLAKIAAAAATTDSVFTLEDRMGILYDVMALSKAGLAKTSDTLTVLEKWKSEKEYLVWSTMSEAISALLVTFWESPEICETLRAFSRTLFVPLVKNLGYEYAASEPTDVTLLRTLAISSALTAQDPEVITEMQGRFKHFMDTADDSKIPADLESAIFITAVKYGGSAEYDAIVKINENPRTPTARLAAISAMTSTRNAELLEKTFSCIMNKSRDQDFIYFFRGLQSNAYARHKVAEFFKANYDALMKRFEGNFTLKYLVPPSFGGLSNEKDLADTEAFFQNRDNSKYSMALAQTLENIRTKIAYIARSKSDVESWLAAWDKRSKL
ncbi:Aminopeptidase [Mycena kentingensis (nom. inval.)]|nr:Aminopeptidase [Mycena kentingensis (nom. inval.)]